MFHASDWLPTIMNMVESNESNDDLPKDLYGINQHQFLKHAKPHSSSKRGSVMHHLLAKMIAYRQDRLISRRN